MHRVSGQFGWSGDVRARRNCVGAHARVCTDYECVRYCNVVVRNATR